MSEPIDRKRFERAPCYLCGYNGELYYQPDRHHCAALYHLKSEPMSREQVVDMTDGHHVMTPTGWQMLRDTDAALRAREQLLEQQRNDYIDEITALRAEVQNLQNALTSIEKDAKHMREASHGDD